MHKNDKNEKRYAYEPYRRHVIEHVEIFWCFWRNLLFQSVLQQASSLMSQGEDHLLSTIQVGLILFLRQTCIIHGLMS